MITSAGLGFLSTAELAKTAKYFAVDKVAYPCEHNKMFYCFHHDDSIEQFLDAEAVYVRKTRQGLRQIVRLWKKEDGVYMIARGYAPILEKRGIAVAPFAEWIEPEPVTHVGSIQLRQYQQEVVLATLIQLRSIGSATDQVATGGGKTYILLAVYDYLRRLRHIKAVWLTLSKDLILQARDMARKAGIPFGIVYGDEYSPSGFITGITVQSAYYAVTGKHLSLIDYPTKKEVVKKREAVVSLIKDADLVIFDESQHIPARSVLAVMKANPNALIVSASGTPKRNDSDTPLIYALSGPIVPRVVTSSELIQLGYLVRPFIVMLKHYTGCRGRGRGVKRYMEVRKCVELSDERAQLIGDIVSALHEYGLTPVMVTVNMKKACHKASNAIRARGIYSLCVSSEINERTRSMIFNAVRQGRLSAVVVTPLGREGLDLPNVISLVMANGGKSVVGVPQTIGRSLRSAPGKKFALVVDIDDTDDVLKQHGSMRRKLYSAEPLWHVEAAESISDLRFIIENVVLKYAGKI
ncbi:MAG: DEAD/DEAH box helicase [Bacteroidota bacterium]